MLKEFTFITLSFNHEKYIEEHLESIRTLIINYGKGIDVHYYLADDGSLDNTVDIVKAWGEKEENKKLFSSFTIGGDGVNRGTVQNLISAISSVKTDNMKFLAGDDCYYDADIFSAIEEAGDDVVLTPCIPMDGKEDAGREMARKYRLLLMGQIHGDIKKFIEYENFIQAPGVLIPGKYLKDKELYEELEPYKLIEDYPMWYYFFHKKNYPVRALPKPYVYYRIDSGVARHKTHQKRSAYDIDLETIEKRIDNNKKKFHVLINPYRYWMALKIFEHKARKKELNAFFEDRDDMKYYISE